MQKGSVIAALDIGSSKISCFIARLIDKEGHFEVVVALHSLGGHFLGTMYGLADHIFCGFHINDDAVFNTVRGAVADADNFKMAFFVNQSRDKAGYLA